MVPITRERSFPIATGKALRYLAGCINLFLSSRKGFLTLSQAAADFSARFEYR